VDYKAGIIHLSSSSGVLLEIHESELSVDDQKSLLSQDVYKKERHKELQLEPGGPDKPKRRGGIMQRLFSGLLGRK